MGAVLGPYWQADVCSACEAPQPTCNWPGQTAGGSLREAWEQAAPAERYCGVCSTPACNDDDLDRFQSCELDTSAGRLYGTGLVSPTPEIALRPMGQPSPHTHAGGAVHPHT
jgi:hypothetical protein